MPTIVNSVDIAASPEQAWTVLSDMTATRQWLPGVVSARMDGTVRVCLMADGQEGHEQISDTSDEERRFRFRHLQVPLPVNKSEGIFVVTAGPAAGTATVRLETTFEPLDPTSADQVQTMISGAFQQSLESLRRYIERSETWDSS